MAEAHKKKGKRDALTTARKIENGQQTVGIVSITITKSMRSLYTHTFAKATILAAGGAKRNSMRSPQ